MGEKQALYQVLHKAGHAIDHLNAKQVSLQHRNAQLEAQLDRLSSTKRKRVFTDPNLQCATVEKVIRARKAEQAAKQSRFDAASTAR